MNWMDDRCRRDLNHWRYGTVVTVFPVAMYTKSNHWKFKSDWIGLVNRGLLRSCLELLYRFSCGVPLNDVNDD